MHHDPGNLAKLKRVLMLVGLFGFAILAAGMLVGGLPLWAIVGLATLAGALAGLAILDSNPPDPQLLKALEAAKRSTGPAPATIKPASDPALLKRIATLEAKLAQISEAISAPEPAPPAEAPEAPQPAPHQPELPMLDPPGHVTLSLAQTIRALNFPKDAADVDGFRVLREALASRDMAELLQAAEDCLNFMSQDQVYMDDLLVAPAGADDWRAFAKGGRARAALLPIKGIHDETVIATVHNRMRTDDVFRDAALVFQRRFDANLVTFVPEAQDREILDLMDTRSGRAFILFAQVNGALS